MSADDPFGSLCEKVVQSGVDSLSVAERRVWRVNCFLCDLETGGLSGFLYNVSPAAGEPPRWTELRAVAAAVAELGGGQLASTLEAAADMLESRLSDKATTWSDAIAPLQVELESLEVALNEASGPLWEAAETAALGLSSDRRA
jgi:hypothetical protein